MKNIILSGLTQSDVWHNQNSTFTDKIIGNNETGLTFNDVYVIIVAAFPEQS